MSNPNISAIQVIEQSLAENPSRVLIKYPVNREYKSATCADFAQAVRHGVEFYKTRLPLEKVDGALPVVGYLSTSHVHYLINLFALMATDVCPLLLSPRNAIAAFVGLLESSQAVALVVEGGRFDGVVKEIKEALPDLKLIDAVTYSDVLMEKADDTKPLSFGIVATHEDAEDVAERRCLALHSSGSTALPKLRFWTNRSSLQNSTLSFASVSEHKDPRTSNLMYKGLLLPAPFFHMMGAVIAFKTFRCGGNVVLPLTNAPHQAKDLVEAIQTSAAENLIVAPSLLESVAHYLSEDTRRWESFRSIKRIVYGGAPCPEDIALAYKAHKIDIRSGYGSTEIGMVMSTVSEDEWDVMEVIVDPKYVRMDPVGDNVYQMFVHTSFAGFASGVTDEEWYDTSDLWLEVRKGAYKHVGRNDDIIVHLNGEKTNPIPLEMSFRTNPLIYEALVIGSGRFQCAAFILLDGEEAKKYAPKEMIRMVEDATKVANVTSPQHSRLVKELVEILPLGHEDFPRTDGKNNVKRKAAEKFLQERIDALYQRYESGETDGKSGVEHVSISELSAGIVSEVMSVDKSVVLSRPDVSLFEVGLDSLGATQVRNKLAQQLRVNLAEDVVFNYSTFTELVAHLRSLRSSGDTSGRNIKKDIRAELSEILGKPLDEGTDDVSMFEIGLDSLGATTLASRLSKFLRGEVKSDVLFEHSSISELANALEKGADAATTPGAKEEAPRIVKTKDLLQKYLKLVAEIKPALKADIPKSHGRTILLTGSTGALGVAILSDLLSKESTSKVICLHRGSDGLDRELKAFEQRGMDTTDFKQSITDRRVEGLVAKFDDSYLGLDKNVFERLAIEVTDIIHAAYPVNWSFPVDAYDGTLRGVYNLIDFCVTGRQKAFHFVSSVSAYMNPEDGKNIPEEPVPRSPNAAADMGYGLSKWICERLMEEASSRLDISATILRCGQLAGDSKTGAWNTTDTFFGLVASGINLRSFPVSDDLVDWIPMDVAAASIVELSMNASGTKEDSKFHVYHIANPKPATWTEITETLASLGHPTKLTPTDEWLDRVRGERAHNPALSNQMLPVLSSTLRSTKMSPHLSMEKTKAASQAIRDGPGMADRTYWSTLLRNLQAVGAVVTGRHGSSLGR
ncbi:hypothetical protein HKX48_004377 [Thoreauomyces humboldtii]|nr:hypothetical protein HKX48_004377 [Thoreauomyces humboldtii]